MAPIEDHAYIKLCSQLASCLSISITSARRKVELEAKRQGIKDPSERKAVAERLLVEASPNSNERQGEASAHFDQLLTAMKKDENFMVED